MTRPRFIPPPPRDVKSIVGEGYVFLPSHDRLNAGKPIPPAVDTVTGPSEPDAPEADRGANSPEANQSPK